MSVAQLRLTPVSRLEAFAAMGPGADLLSLLCRSAEGRALHALGPPTSVLPALSRSSLAWPAERRLTSGRAHHLDVAQCPRSVCLVGDCAVVVDSTLRGLVVLDAATCSVMGTLQAPEWVLPRHAVCVPGTGELVISDAGAQALWVLPSIWHAGPGQRIDVVGSPAGVAVAVTPCPERRPVLVMANSSAHHVATRELRPHAPWHVIGGPTTEADEPGCFVEPVGVAVTPGNDVVVTENGTGRVQVLSLTGAVLACLDPRYWSGVGALGKWLPSVAVCPRTGCLLVADVEFSRVVVLRYVATLGHLASDAMSSATGSCGGLVEATCWGGLPGPRHTAATPAPTPLIPFQFPWGVACGVDGRIWVADSGAAHSLFVLE